MEIVHARNVNDAFDLGINLLWAEGVDEDSRAGKVRVMPCPVTTIYEKPTERVLFLKQRDANPFFHLMESLWMLAGRDDAHWLDNFVSDFSSRFAEVDGHQHGAYGHRWRKAFGFDQLDCVVEKLRKNPNDRQCVLQMWDADASNDLRGNWKDRPCNTHIYLRIRNKSVSEPAATDYANLERVLDITVCCRSNDAIWGAYGANAVHFSVMQEYLAKRIGVNVGKYYQISNNFHAYYDVLPQYEHLESNMVDAYQAFQVKPTVIVSDAWKFDEDLVKFFSTGVVYENTGVSYANRFFIDTAIPMFWSYKLWRAKKYEEALDRILTVPPLSDWGRACRQWFERRMEKRQKKVEGTRGAA